MRVRIVVADQSEARFYDAAGLNGALQLAGNLLDPKAHLHERDLVSDRPGRVFDQAPSGSGRRGAVGHHSTGEERSAKKHEAATFARHVADALEVAIRQRLFERVVVMAAPPFLGRLREAFPRSVQKAIVAEVPKDLLRQPEDVVRAHLPRETFWEVLPES